jgi:hypothetical protein
MKTIHPASPAGRFFPVFCLSLALVSGAFAQTSISNSIPVVSIRATDNHGTWTGDPAVFTIFRSGDTAPALNVYCCISGTATNGMDYQAISSFVFLPAGVRSNTVAIKPINLGQTDIRTVTIDLCPSPLMTPVNYVIGSPGTATAFITPPGVSNLPPDVNIISPAGGAVFYTPVDISLIARAIGFDGSISNVEFFANHIDLGRGVPVILDPPGVNGVTGLIYFLNWQNVPANVWSLTAVATDNGSLSITSAPVKITVLPGPTPTNRPPVVRITSPPNGAVFRAPVNIPIFSYAADPDGTVTTVEFFAGAASLGFGHRVIATPPPLPAGSVQPPIAVVVPTNYWELTWTNPPLETNIALTAKATDNGGASTVSTPVFISILPSLPPPTNRPPMVSIVATDPIAIEGTNCWPWLGLVGPVPTWADWFAVSPAWRVCTNCGPKDATFTVFRFGATNDNLDVAYAIGGTAANGIDYVALPGSVTILAGERRADITVVPLDDGPPDITSSVVLKLIPDATGTNYLPGYPRAAAAIILDSQSPRAVTGTLPGPAFNLSAAGPDGAWFHVEYSTDLTHWTPICTNQVVNGCIDFVDPDAAANPARFYRTVPEPGPPQ